MDEFANLIADDIETTLNIEITMSQQMTGDDFFNAIGQEAPIMHIINWRADGMDP